MSISLKVRLKVSSVSSAHDPEGRENIRITFVETRARPPMVAMMPQDTPREISSVVLQVQKGIQQVLPKGSADIQKIVLVLTPEEIEAFHTKPYPSQIYEVTISDGNLKFKNVSL
jgi:hypothetical protein